MIQRGSHANRHDDVVDTSVLQADYYLHTLYEYRATALPGKAMAKQLGLPD